MCLQFQFNFGEVFDLLLDNQSCHILKYGVEVLSFFIQDFWDNYSCETLINMWEDEGHVRLKLSSDADNLFLECVEEIIDVEEVNILFLHQSDFEFTLDEA